MNFTDIIFVPFVVVTFFVFFFMKNSPKGQIFWLLLSSYFFYGWWKVSFLPLIIFSSALDFWIGKRLGETDENKKRKRLLILSLSMNLGLLGFFKYFNFFASSTNAVLTSLGIEGALPILNIILPVGISFYTFQTLSYTLDIYFKQIEPTSSPLKFFFYVSAFPQLVAGPIVRAKDFLPQLEGNLFAKSDTSGLFDVYYGIVKKLFVSDLLAHYFVDAGFANPSAYSGPDLLLASYGYALQIFLDFSAYSNIAIGLGKIFGFQLPVNFLQPYHSSGPSEFWRRWHITLSTWLRDYLYIPLGGNKGSSLRLARNLVIVMFLGGLWHGASWNFVIWGLYHGLLLVIYHLLGRSESKGKENFFLEFGKKTIFFHLVCLGWVFFRAEDLRTAMNFLAGLFHFNERLKFFDLRNLLLLSVGVGIHSFCEAHIESLRRSFSALHWSVWVLITMILFSGVYFLDQQSIAHKAFIYFRF